MAFQSNAFQNDAFQTTGDAVCTPAFNPNGFQNNAFQVCPETGECVPAFQLGAFLSAAFQVCEEAPQPTPEVVIDTGDGKKRDRARRDFEQRQDDWRADLRRIIERAFDEREEVEQVAALAPIAKPEKRRMAQSILARTDFGPLQLSLAEIIRQIDEYQQALVIEARRRDDEEAILMLMLSDV